MSHITREMISTGAGGPISIVGALFFVAIILAAVSVVCTVLERMTRP